DRPDGARGPTGLAAGGDIDAALHEHVERIGRIPLANDGASSWHPDLPGLGREPLEGRPGRRLEDRDPLERCEARFEVREPRPPACVETPQGRIYAQRDR